MIPAKFDYIKTTSISEAVNLLDEHGFDAKILSGGQSLLPAMKLRLNRPEIVIDINGIPDMNSIEETGDEVIIGANCTHTQILNSDVVYKTVNILHQAVTTLGDVQVSTMSPHRSTHNRHTSHKCVCTCLSDHNSRDRGHCGQP